MQTRQRRRHIHLNHAASSHTRAPANTNLNAGALEHSQRLDGLGRAHSHHQITGGVRYEQLLERHVRARCGGIAQRPALDVHETRLRERAAADDLERLRRRAVRRSALLGARRLAIGLWLPAHTPYTHTSHTHRTPRSHTRTYTASKSNARSPAISPVTENCAIEKSTAADGAAASDDGADGACDTSTLDVSETLSRGAASLLGAIVSSSVVASG
jgi:hypothetical protein